MGDNGSFWLPESVSTLAPEIDSLFYFVTWVSVILFIGVMGGLIFFAWKYRRRSEDDMPLPVHENVLLEISWIVIPTILVLVVFNWGFKTFIEIGVAPPDAYEIHVTGAQWRWDFEYPEGFTTTGELHVPVDRPVKLIMSSSDVIHSLFIPAFRVKHDVLPNRYTSLWFQATKEGVYDVFCTEYCGTAHSGMLAEVTVHSEENFRAFLQSGGGGYDDMPLPEYGALLYERQQCQQCHSLDGSRLVGPSFQGLFGRQEQIVGQGSVLVDENYLRESILQPSAKIVEGYPNGMPPYASLNERQVSALIEFIKQQ